MNVKVLKLCKEAKTPHKGSKDAFAYDLTATSVEDKGDGRIVYGTGLALQIERDECDKQAKDLTLGFQIRPRSSVHKTGLSLANSIGTIDEDYTGELKAVFYNILNELPNYKVGDRIGQLAIDITTNINFVESSSLKKTDRGIGGFGSTGK